MTRVARSITVCLAVWLWAAMPAASSADDAFLRPDQLKPGMKGFGLSVFKGTKTERFDVEIMGVLPNAFPKQDMILIRLSGANLEKHKVIAGMSGSPIYIENKLIGALAYGWQFENEPLAGVTPIHNMLAEKDRSDAGKTPMTRRQSDGNLNAPQPLLTPVSFGGFSPRVLELLSADFASVGMLPVAGGGVADTTNDTAPANGDTFQPGGAIGVAMIRGDFNAVAVGTVTHVDGNRVLAFGHPFFGGGITRAPAMLADVQMVMSSMARSFKMAVGTREIGAMVGDWQSCIVADTSVKADMLPVAIDVVNRGTGHREAYRVEVMRNPVFTARLVLASILESIAAATGASEPATVTVEVEVDIAPLSPGGEARTVKLQDTAFNAGGELVSPRPLTGALQLFNTPFGNPEIKAVRAKVDAALERRTAEIKRAYFADAELVAGSVAPLTVVLKPFDAPEVKRVINIPVPAVTDGAQELVVVVLDGATAPLDAAAPDSLDDYVNTVARQRSGTDLVALVPTRSQGMQYRGQLLRNLPPSVLGVLDDSSTRDVLATMDVQHVVAPTDWVLSGRAIVRAPIKEE